MGSRESREEAAEGAESRINWVGGLAPAGACVLARVRHPRGLPRGAARMISRWVQRGSARFPSSMHVQEALTRHGSEFACTHALDYTEFCVNTSDWKWGLEFLLDLLAHPLLDADVYEDLQMESDEEWRSPGLAQWVARAWGWVSPAPVQSAAQLRGVWEHLYTFRYIRLSVGGALPARAPAGLQGLIQRATRAEPWPAAHAAPWAPPADNINAAPPPGTHATLPVLHDPMASLSTTDHHAGGAGAVLALLTPMPPRLTACMRDCMELLLEDQFDHACRECPSWAQRVRCTWYAMGSTALVLALECVVSPSISVPAFVQQVRQLLQRAPPSLEAVERAYGALQKRQRVRYTRLGDALRQAIDPPPYTKTAEQMHGAVHQLYDTYLLAERQPVTCLVVRRKNTAVGQRRSYSSDARRRRSKDMGGAHALCPPPPNTSKTPEPPAVRA